MTVIQLIITKVFVKRALATQGLLIICYVFCIRLLILRLFAGGQFLRALTAGDPLHPMIQEYHTLFVYSLWDSTLLAALFMCLTYSALE